MPKAPKRKAVKKKPRPKRPDDPIALGVAIMREATEKRNEPKKKR